MHIYLLVFDNLFFSFNNVIPVFLIILIGFFLKRKILTAQFSNTSNKLVFNIALPAMIFNSIYTTDLRTVFDINIILFSIAGTIILFLTLTAGAFLFFPDKRSIGSFVQGSFRSNFVIIGMPLIKNLSETLGQDAVIKSTILISFIMPLYNVLAVLILSVSSTEKNAVTFGKIVMDILKNPLILSVLAALPFSLFSISTPLFFSKTINNIAAIAVPLALIDIGYNISFKGFLSTLQPTLLASLIKIVVSPLLFTTLAYFLNFRGSDLGVLYILFASPTAISSYVMAKGMKNNAELAANIVLISTLGSMITIFAGVFILRSLGLFAA